MRNLSLNVLASNAADHKALCVAAVSFPPSHGNAWPAFLRPHSSEGNIGQLLHLARVDKFAAGLNIVGISQNCRALRVGGDVSTFQEYQHRAADCLRLMRTAIDETNKALLLEMAQAWIRLAEQQRARDQAQSEG
jgi:hypothetical protein